jgi:phage terminase large subunit-like protein
MSRKAYPNVNAANQYARHVVAGKIPACQYVIDACQRHIDDLSKSQERNFDTALIKTLLSVQRVYSTSSTYKEWAFKRMPITLEPWQLFIVCCSFGWVHKGPGCADSERSIQKSQEKREVSDKRRCGAFLFHL